MPEVLQQAFITLRIKHIITETADTRSFILAHESGKGISYVAGQFLTFVFKKNNGEETRRNYSISSSPVLNEPLQITVKRIANGEFSRKLIDTAKEGDVLTTIGASGFFTLPANMGSYDQLVFFAAGSGIAPVFSLIKTVLHAHPAIHIVLIYSNHSVEKAIFYQQLNNLQKQFPDRFQIEFLFSNATSVLHKRLGIHLLEKLLHQHVHSSLQRQLFYLCGPFEYMRMITIVLKNNGVTASHIRKEIFIIEKPYYKPEPPDKESHTVSLTILQRDFSFQTQYPDTILQTAKALKIQLPYSCESGQCGTCAATCLSGKVWMSHNDVLTDEEVAKGRVLTCTGYATGGDVTLGY